MAVIKDPINSDNSVNYVATLAFFCCVSCVTFMLKFGFKASLNLFSGKQKHAEKYRETDTNVSVTGAYRTNRDEFFRTGRVSDPPRKLAPSVVKLPTSENNAPTTPIRSVKSTGNLTTINEISSPIRSAPSVSLNPRGEDTSPRRENTKEKEQKRIDKERLAQEKTRQKQEAKEQAKQDKLKKEREKKEAQQAKRSKKKKAPQPQSNQVQSAPVASSSQGSNPLGQAPVRYSSNTLESSISRNSGPPPYSETPNDSKGVSNNDSSTSNVTASNNITFSKPIDTGSWDMISKHRQQIDRPTQSGALKEKRMVMDLNYNFNNNLSVHDDKQNSQA